MSSNWCWNKECQSYFVHFIMSACTQISTGILAHKGWQDLVVWYFTADRAMKEGERREGRGWSGVWEDILGCQSLLDCHLHESILFRAKRSHNYCEEPAGLNSVFPLTFMSTLDRCSTQFWGFVCLFFLSSWEDGFLWYTSLIPFPLPQELILFNRLQYLFNHLKITLENYLLNPHYKYCIVIVLLTFTPLFSSLFFQ